MGLQIESFANKSWQRKDTYTEVISLNLNNFGSFLLIERSLSLQFLQYHTHLGDLNENFYHPTHQLNLRIFGMP
jgi:ssRNA-specific RNase YbeY (16S rRNA maturation enzyme)